MISKHFTSLLGYTHYDFCVVVLYSSKQKLYCYGMVCHPLLDIDDLVSLGAEGSTYSRSICGGMNTEVRRDCLINIDYASL